MAGPLANLFVLDLTWALAGPYATMIMGDLGAKVIKVEKPGEGDPSRVFGPFVNGVSSYFASISRGKKSVAIDFKTPAGQALIRKLAAKADVLVENFRPGSLDKLGLDYASIKKVNPRIIYASCSGFGSSGRYRDKLSMDVIVQGMAGTMSITGEPGRSPARVGFSVGDIGAGIYLTIGILSALYQRELSGQGQYVETCLLDSQLALLENAAARFLLAGENPQPMGSRHPVITPFQAFKTKDGYMVLALATQRHWQLFWEKVGRPEIAKDERFVDNAGRCKNQAELEAIINDLTSTRTTKEWVAELEQAGLPCGPVNTMADILTDPHIAERGIVAEIKDKQAGTFRLINNPLRFSRTPGQLKDGIPALGEHTEEVLKYILGLSQEEINELRKAGAIG